MWATTLGFENIYLLGIDLAISKDGQSHSSTHQLTKTRYNQKDVKSLSSSISFRGDFFQIKGNFQEKVYTNPLFYSSLQSLHEMLPIMKSPHQNIYNLNDGAYLTNTLPLDINSIQNMVAIKKENLLQEIHSHLQPYSKTQLSKEDIASLYKRLEFSIELKNMLTTYKESPLALQANTYLYNIISIALSILQDPTRENRNLINVYDYYMSYVMPIIFDFFNTKELDNTKKHIKKLDRMFLEEMFEIEKIYENSIRKFLEARKSIN
jgi:hypothetical protein